MSSIRSLPAPVQLPSLAYAGRQLLSAGGLSAVDASVADVVRVAPGRAARIGSLPQAAHDAGAATLGEYMYTFGGGTASGPIDNIVRLGTGGAKIVGHLPRAMSDTTAVALGNRIYVIGGYTTTTPLRSVIEFQPGRTPRTVLQLPYPLRYAAAAAVDGQLLIAGGTNGTTARREIIRVDPMRRRAAVIGRLPAPIGHAAGAALGGTFFVLGGRGDALNGQRDTIEAIDPKTGAVSRGGRLPAALSDLSAVTSDGHIVAVGGRDRAGTVHGEVLTLTAPTPSVHRTAAIPPPLDHRNVYAADRHLANRVRQDPARVYVPNSQSATVDVVSQRTGRIVDHFAVGKLPQHVTPSYDLRTLWVTNDEGNSLTPIDPRTGNDGRPVAVTDPYNLYFTADGRRAVVVAEAHKQLDFRQPHTMRLEHSLAVPSCAGVDHMDYTADGRFALVSCEFAGRMIVVDMVRERVIRNIELRKGGMPQDVKLSPDGRTFYVADMASNGVWLINARTWKRLRLQPTGRGAHGLYPSRDARTLYVSNRGDGSISLISFRTGKPYRRWRLPGGGSPDMGGVSADGRTLWLTGRYDGELYAISTRTGRLVHRIHVGAGPHGACVWPQPGRYSIGHTGILR